MATYNLRNTTVQGLPVGYYQDQIEFVHTVNAGESFAFEADRLTPATEAAVQRRALVTVTGAPLPDPVTGAVQTGFALQWRNAWDLQLKYIPGDVVAHGGDYTWLCRSACAGLAPGTDDSVWTVFGAVTDAVSLAAVAGRLGSLERRRVLNRSGAAVVLVPEDVGAHVRLSHVADATVTVPAGLASGRAGNELTLFNSAASSTRTLVAGSGVQLNAPAGALVLPAKASASLTEVAADEWDVFVAGGALPAPMAPVATSVPTVAGTRMVGQTLTATPAVWSTVPDSTAYQWFRGESAISGATGTTYLLAAADAGFLVSFRVVATNTSGSTASGSVETEYVASLLATVATDTGSSPSTAAVTLSGLQDAVQVWAGETSAQEAYSDLYVTRNGGTPYKVRTHRFGGYVLAGDPGTVFRFATSDGRTLKVSATIAGTALNTSFPVSGTAAVDRAGPPLWAPTAPHVTLAANNSSFEIVGDGTETAVFVSQYDGTSWTPPRWVRLPASGSVRFRARYKRVALATYAGTALTVNAPAGSTVGGSSAVMHLPFSAITGTTYSVSTVSEFKAAIAAAVAGDLILLADGTYALDIEVLSTTFASNYVSGRQGGEGITIRSASGNKDACVITGDGTGNHGNWVLGRNVYHASPLPFMVRDVKFVFTGLDAGFLYQGGRVLLENVHTVGPQLGSTTYDLFSLGAHLEGYSAVCLRCSGTDAAADIYNVYGAASLTTGSVTLIDCVGARAGGFSNSQVLTPHDGMRLLVYGGEYSDAHTFVIQGSVVSDPTYLFCTKIRPGARKSAIYWVSCFGCDLSVTNDIKLLSSGYLVSNRIATAAGYGSNAVVREAATEAYYMAGNLFDLAATGNAAPAWFPNVATSTRFHFNLVLSGMAAQVSSDTGDGTASLVSNTAVGAGTAFSLLSASLAVTFRGNATKTSSTSVSCTVSSLARITRAYNVLDPTVDADYAAGTGDITGVDAALDASHFPTAGGNCDGTATMAQLGLDHIGGSDYQGLVNLYSQATADRGARGRPRVVSGAELLPDVW